VTHVTFTGQAVERTSKTLGDIYGQYTHYKAVQGSTRRAYRELSRVLAHPRHQRAQDREIKAGHAGVAVPDADAGRVRSSFKSHGLRVWAALWPEPAHTGMER
jgi:hypothetical protein